MIFKLRVAHIEHTYTFLRAMPPFHRMRLPEADDVVFRALTTRQYGGHFKWQEGAPYEIAVSSASTEDAHALLEIVAHEMIHLYQKLNKTETRSHHNAEFRRISARVCQTFNINHAEWEKSYA